MRAFKFLMLAVLTAAVLLALPGVALANGGDIHLGAVSTGIPVAAAYGAGGFVGVMILFFLASWARYKRSLSSDEAYPEPEEEEEDNGT